METQENDFYTIFSPEQNKTRKTHGYYIQVNFKSLCVYISKDLASAIFVEIPAEAELTILQSAIEKNWYISKGFQGKTNFLCKKNKPNDQMRINGAIPLMRKILKDQMKEGVNSYTIKVEEQKVVSFKDHDLFRLLI